jgi:hypothetical protein
MLPTGGGAFLGLLPMDSHSQAAPDLPGSVERAPWSEQGLRRLMAALFLLTCLALLFGVWVFYPFFEREHRRLEPWKVGLLYLTHAVAFLWFCYYFARHCLLGQPFRQHARGSPKLERETYVALVTICLGWSVDLCMTLLLQHDEETRFQQALPAAGEVYALQRRVYPMGGTQAVDIRYVLECRYTDPAGNPHANRFTIWDCRQKDMDLALDKATIDTLERGQVPFDVKVSYDPDWPERFWLTEAPWAHWDNLHHFSLFIIIQQAVFFLAFFKMLRFYKQTYQQNPWWHDLYLAFPLMVTAATLVWRGIPELTTYRTFQ